jgi:hypothetical protein
MSLISFLASAAAGPLLGGAVQFLSAGVGELKEWSASKRRIAEIVAMKERDIAIGELNAFTAAVSDLNGSHYTPPDSAPSWMHALFTIAEFTVRMVRPSMVAGACWYIWTLPPAALQGLQGEVVAVSFATIYFWLGIRQNKPTK